LPRIETSWQAVTSNRMRSSRREKLRHMRTKPAVSKRRKTSSGQLTIGIDIGDQWSYYCTLNEVGDVIEEGRFRTTRSALAKHFSAISAVRVAIENGTHSIWISEQLRGYGHEVIVANVQELQAISRRARTLRQSGPQHFASDFTPERGDAARSHSG
jgi:activator of 2-hydroxyglutaryl-CoA dehydratase